MNTDLVTRLNQYANDQTPVEVQSEFLEGTPQSPCEGILKVSGDKYKLHIYKFVQGRLEASSISTAIKIEGLKTIKPLTDARIKELDAKEKTLMPIYRGGGRRRKRRATKKARKTRRRTFRR